MIAREAVARRGADEVLVVAVYGCERQLLRDARGADAACRTDRDVRRSERDRLAGDDAGDGQRSECAGVEVAGAHGVRERKVTVRADIGVARVGVERRKDEVAAVFDAEDRKSTRLNYSH